MLFTKNDKYEITAVTIILFFILCGLLFTDGQYWISSALLLWILIAFFIFTLLEFMCYDLFQPWLEQKLEGISKKPFFKNHSSKNFSPPWLTKSNHLLFKHALPIIIGVMIIFPYLTFHMAALTHWKADQNISECKRIAFQSIDCAFTNESKAKQILVYFDDEKGNIYNAYRMNKNYLLGLDRGNIQFYSTYPYIAVRTYSDNDPCWILTSEFGHCGEYANLNRYMCHQIGLRVRKVCTDGENHCWNEVYINDSIGWTLIDATTVFLDDEKNGYDNVNKTWMKQKLGGNLSHVVAQELNGNYVDITNNYTTISNVTVKTIDSQGNPIPNSLVKVYSNNRYNEGRFTTIKGKTDNRGEYNFSVGIGNYTYKAQKNKKVGINTSIISKSQNTIIIRMY